MDKKCTVCRELQPFENFHNLKRSNDGKGYRCKSCDRLARLLWKDNNRERARISQRARNLKHRFGITLEEYAALFKKQGNRCAICAAVSNKTAGSGTYWNFSVDHCHVSGKIRGILCNRCNRSIGLFEDDATLLREAAKYLDRATEGLTHDYAETH